MPISNHFRLHLAVHFRHRYYWVHTLCILHICMRLPILIKWCAYLHMRVRVPVALCTYDVRGRIRVPERVRVRIHLMYVCAFKCVLTYAWVFVCMCVHECKYAGACCTIVFLGILYNLGDIRLQACVFVCLGCISCMGCIGYVCACICDMRIAYAQACAKHARKRACIHAHLRICATCNCMHALSHQGQSTGACGGSGGGACVQYTGTHTHTHAD